MSEKVKVLMERFYKVPEQTENEKELYAWGRKLRRNLDAEQGATLDALMETCVDCIGDASEDGFRQGIRAGVELINELS